MRITTLEQKKEAVVIVMVFKAVTVAARVIV